MMKEQVEISRYTEIDSQYGKLLQLHRDISRNTGLHGKLIYFDENFDVYFRKVISDVENNFICTLQLNKVIQGFIHLKFIEDTVFLNNISLADEVQGKGMGKFFLTECLKMITARKNFSLDVLESNTRALNWYCKLGLKKEFEVLWQRVELTDEISQYDGGLTFKADHNGFKSLMLKNAKIGTFISNKTLLLHQLNKMPPQLFTDFEIITNQRDIKMETIYRLLPLETTFRMKCSFNQVLKNLINA